jgi:Predicted membrane protein (DUF2157)
MLSFEPEIAAAELSPATAVRLIAVQRREVFSLFAEIRALAWIGAMLIASGVSVLISKHINEIGPLTIAIVLAVVAAACYAWAWMRRDRQSLVNDSILLLGAMLVSADAGWIESQWHTFGPRALLFLAVFHAVGAYRYNSRALLSLSIGALAGWFGIDRKIDFIFSSSVDLALRAFVCAAILAVWREVDRRARKATIFTLVFDHTALSLAFVGALILATNRDTSGIGVLVMLTLATATTIYAFRANNEAYLLYAVIFTTIALDAWVWQNLHGDALRSFLTLILAIAAVAGLMSAHRRFRSRAA